MLGKLIKYEWKSTYKVGLILLLAMVMATLMGFLTFQAPMWRDLGGRYTYDTMGTTMLNVVSIFSFMLYVMLLMGAIYAALIYFVVRFYKSMYTDQGYLLHTLPVGKNEILVSKILISSIWLYLVYIAMTVSIVVFVVSMVSSISGESFASVLGAIPQFFEEVNYLFSTASDFLVQYFVMALINIILGVPAGIIVFYGAVSFGQLFSKHRVLMAIVGYVAIMVIRGILGSVLQVGFSFGSAMLDSGALLGTMYSSMFSQLILDLLMAVGCYLLSYYVTARKLNME